MGKIDKEILEKMPQAYQLFYKMCNEAGIDIIEEDKND